MMFLDEDDPRSVTEAAPDLFADAPRPKRKPQPKSRRAGMIPRRQIRAAMALYAPPPTRQDESDGA